MRIFIADSDGGYRRPSTILGDFAEDLAEWTGAREIERVQWPAPGAGGRRRSHTWASASAAGVADLNRLVRLHPSDDLVLIGACCGTRVIHDWMDAHPEDLDRVVAVGLIADPFRPRDRWLAGTPDPRGQGVAGLRRGPIPDRTHWVSVPGDPLSGVRSSSLLRGAVRDSELTPAQVYDDLVAGLPDTRTRVALRLHVAQHPGLWSPRLVRRLDDTTDTLLRYRDGTYLTQYTAGDDSPMARLATVIADQVAGDRAA